MKLTSVQIQTHLGDLPGWSTDGRALIKEYRFTDFMAAFRFMTAAAAVAQELNHHPEWTNVYNRVSVRLSTHEEDGVTPLDIELAERMDALV
jgi:4a-hydroxytetrahydrobiopterin dehydratase